MNFKGRKVFLVFIMILSFVGMLACGYVVYRDYEAKKETPYTNVEIIYALEQVLTDNDEDLSLFVDNFSASSLSQKPKGEIAFDCSSITPFARYCESHRTVFPSSEAANSYNNIRENALFAYLVINKSVNGGGSSFNQSQWYCERSAEDGYVMLKVDSLAGDGIYIDVVTEKYWSSFKLVFDFDSEKGKPNYQMSFKNVNITGNEYSYYYTFSCVKDQRLTDFLSVKTVDTNKYSINAQTGTAKSVVLYVVSSQKPSLSSYGQRAATRAGDIATVTFAAGELMSTLGVNFSELDKASSITCASYTGLLQAFNMV